MNDDTSMNRCSRLDVIILTSVTLLYLCLAFTALDWHCFWSDEFHTIKAVRLPWREMVVERAIKGHPPLFFVLEKVWTSNLPQNELSYRSLPAFFALATIWLTYIIVKLKAGTVPATFSTLLVLTSGSQLLVNQLARSYTLLQLLMVAQLFILIISPKHPRTIHLASFGILVFLALATHGSALVSVPALLLAAILVNSEWWQFTAAGAVAAVSYLCMSSSLAGLTSVSSHIDWVASASFETFVTFPAVLQFGRQVGMLPKWLAIAFSISVLIAALYCCRGSKLEALLALEWVATWLATALISLTGIGVYSVERYFMTALHCQGCLAALLVGRLMLRHPAFAIVAASVFVCAAIASTALFATVPPFTPWREMAHKVMIEMNQGEQVHIFTKRAFATPFNYYFVGEVQYIEAFAEVTFTRDTKAMWICFLDYDADENRIPDWLAREFPKTECCVYYQGGLVKLSRD